MLVYTVAEVTRYLKGLLGFDPLLGDLWVTGEVSNLSRSAAGHVYFTLKDGEGQLKCVLFRAHAQRSLPLSDGSAVLAHGRVSLYEASGALQFYVDLVQPEGLGRLHREFEVLKARLEAEGLFDASRKRPLPRFPERIGVVTSPTGAVLHDIANVVRRRFPLAELILAPALVQGEGAASSLVGALAALNRLADLDVIILARGGGSLEDLWPFNEECVARAVFASRVPVVSGVGHETDVTIADLVADLRAPTPSAAAELVVPDRAELKVHLADQVRSLQGEVDAHLARWWQTVDRWVSDLERLAPDVERRRQGVSALEQAIRRVMDTRLVLESERWKSRCLQLHALSPLLTLARGYAVVTLDSSGEVVRSAAQVAGGDAITVRVGDGSFAGEVTRRCKP